MNTLHEAASAVRQGNTTPLDLVEDSLRAIDRWEGKVHAWVFVDRDGARAEARRLGDELKQGQYRGPLHGMPIAIKDIFDVFDWPTAAGSKLWAQSIARQDAPLVQRLRQAGAIFLGKTVTTQYASFDPPVTRNPWNLERTPGGSSSGSAAALATGMCLGAMGSQTGGSITRPASYCGVAGLKPTYGRLPLEGIVPLAPTMDHPGPMARCVRDLAIMMNVLDGGSVDYLSEAGHDHPPRIGVLHGLFQDLAEASVWPALEKNLQALDKAGAAIQNLSLPASFAEVLPRHRIVMAVEGAAFHRERLQRHADDYQAKVRSLLEEGLACPAPEYARCKDHQDRLTEEMLDCFADVDILLTPATTGPAPAADTTGNPAFNSPWSYTGLPTVSFPTGQFADGLPLAIQLVGRPHDEVELVGHALWCEKVLGAGVLQPRM